MKTFFALVILGFLSSCLTAPAPKNPKSETLTTTTTDKKGRIPQNDQVNDQVFQLWQKWSPKTFLLVSNTSDPRTKKVLEVVNGFLNMMKVHFDFEIRQFVSDPNFNAVNSLPTLVHEGYHSFISRSEKESALFILDFTSPVSLPPITTPPSKDSAYLLSEDLKTWAGFSRIGTYLDPKDPNYFRTVTQVQGIYGLLNEYTAYLLGAQVSADLLDYYLEREHYDFKALRRLLGTTQNGITAQREFRLFLLNYLLHIKNTEPALYNSLFNMAGLRTLIRDIGSKSNREVERIRSGTQAIIDLYEDPRVLKLQESQEKSFGPYRVIIDREIDRKDLVEVRSQWGL